MAIMRVAMESVFFIRNILSYFNKKMLLFMKRRGGENPLIYFYILLFQLTG